MSPENKALIAGFGRGLLDCLSVAAAPLTLAELNVIMNAVRAEERAKAVEVARPFAEAAEFWAPIYDDSEVMKLPAQFVDAWRAKHGKKRPVPQFVNGDLRRAAAYITDSKGGA